MPNMGIQFHTAAVFLFLSAGLASAQAPRIPRLADGHPDLQGTYDLATLTPVERPAGANATLTSD